MNIFIYILAGVIAGLIIGYFWWPRLNRSDDHLTGQAGILTEQMAEKEKNLTKIREYIIGKDKITNDEIQSLLKVSDATIVRYLDELEKEGIIKQVGETGKYTYYKIV